MNIRPVALKDIEAYRALRLEALRDNPVAFPSEYEQQMSLPREFWAERISDPLSVIFVAERDGRFIGMTGVHRSDRPKLRHSGELWGVYVQPEFRGQHIAEALIDACVTWAKGQGLVILKLGVTATNAAAIRCYVRCGFSIYGLEPAGIFFDGQYYDGVLMYRRLG